MRFLRSILFISVMTVMALLYVHQQIELVKLSYLIECKEKAIKDMLDHKESLGYNIDNLESPSRLEGALLAKNIAITFPKRGQVIKVVKVPANMNGGRALNTIGLEKKVNIFGIFEFFSAGREAQAKEK